MSEEDDARRRRARCAWWLSAQCDGGAKCTCLPYRSLADTAVDPLPQQVDVPQVPGVLLDRPEQHLTQ